MAFTVEDGTGLEDANAFVGVTDFVSYWAERGLDLSDLDGELVQAAIVKATDYMELRFALKWKGIKLSIDQGIGWPRKYVYNREGAVVASDSVPKKVKAACYEYAKRALDAALLPDPVDNPNIISKTETIGPISTSITYAGGVSATKLQAYPSADMLLVDFIVEAAGSYR